MALVFPSIRPLGPQNSGAANTIRDSRQYPNRVVDYLKIDIYDSQSNNPYTQVGNGASPQGGKNLGTAAESIYLILPNNLVEKYTTKYQDVSLGAIGLTALDTASSALASGDVSGLGEKLAAGAKAAVPEIAFKAASKGLGALTKFGGGDQISAGQVSALTQKRIFNPYKETVFEGVEYRNHAFTFKLAPRSASEVQTIYKIIDALRNAMLPGTSASGLFSITNSQSGPSRSDRWLTIPDFFGLSIVRYTAGSDGDNLVGGDTARSGGILQQIMTFPVKTVLQDMSINLTPDGRYVSLRDGTSAEGSTDEQFDYGPNAYQLDLVFRETAFLTKDYFSNNSPTPLNTP